MTFLRRERVERTARCDSALLTAHDVLIIATDDDDDADTARYQVDSSLFEWWKRKLEWSRAEEENRGLLIKMFWYLLRIKDV